MQGGIETSIATDAAGNAACSEKGGKYSKPLPALLVFANRAANRTIHNIFKQVFAGTSGENNLPL
jgi:hypothetical protein